MVYVKFHVSRADDGELARSKALNKTKKEGRRLTLSARGGNGDPRHEKSVSCSPRSSTTLIETLAPQTLA